LIRSYLTLPLLLSTLLLLVTAAVATPDRARAEGGCVFPFTPTTYEDLKDRRLFLDTIELASYNFLFPGDAFFGIPDLEMGPRDARYTEPGRVPPVLLKSIAYVESSITQGASGVPYGSIGPALIAFDCGHGVAQVTSGMTVPSGENGRGSPEQALVATHYAYNIARGANILATKWNDAPEEKPIVGTDTLGHPAVIENWYYAVWAYNGFTGPGASKSNHPLDPIYGAWPRTPYSCGSTTDGLGHNRSNYPYQEIVYGCVTNPPVVEGNALWQAQEVSLPDLNDTGVRGAMGLQNFVFPYSRMDIVTPQPFHMDLTPAPDIALRDRVLGAPQLAVNSEWLQLDQPSETSPAFGFAHVFNTGTGVLPWYAVASVPWATLLPYTGVAVGLEMPCTAETSCDRFGHVGVIVDPATVPDGETEFQIFVQALGTSQVQIINVSLGPVTARAP
jgi:hypothetical protein